MKRLNKIAKRIIAKEGYTFNELSKEVQDKLIQNEAIYIVDVNNEEFEETVCIQEIDKIFPNGEVNYTYSLNGFKNDGFGLYGYINVEDAIALCGMTYTYFEIRFLEDLIYGEISIHNNANSPYFSPEMIDISESYDETVSKWFEEWKDDSIVDDNFNVKAFCEKNKKLEKELRIKLAEFCDEMEQCGYEFIYTDVEEITKDELMNDSRLYDENGNVL